MLSKEAIEEFQEIYYREFGIKLTNKEATKQASDLIRLYRSVLSTEGNEFIEEKKDNRNLRL